MGGMIRGDFVTIALQGDFGKPRPALVIQSDYFSEHATITVLLVTSTIVEAPLLRITIKPTPENGLQKISQIMIDKAMTISREKIGATFGHIDLATLLKIEQSLLIFLGIGN
jgi:mRNA interferase MazF